MDPAIKWCGTIILILLKCLSIPLFVSDGLQSCRQQNPLSLAIRRIGACYSICFTTIHRDWTGLCISLARLTHMSHHWSTRVYYENLTHFIRDPKCLSQKECGEKRKTLPNGQRNVSHSVTAEMLISHICKWVVERNLWKQTREPDHNLFAENSLLFVGITASTETTLCGQAANYSDPLIGDSFGSDTTAAAHRVTWLVIGFISDPMSFCCEL